MTDRRLLAPFLGIVVLLLALPARGQDADVRVFRGDGTPTSLDGVTEALEGADALLIGEAHDDSLAHVLELRLLETAYARRGDDVALSLEMFERDVQPVVDEYLVGLITEEHFLQSSRPWTNYADYRPLVAFARAHDLAVIAANAPRRYVNRVARLGAASLDALPPSARTHLAPLPYPPPSDAYRKKWIAQVAHGVHGAPPNATEETGAEASPHAAPPDPPHGAMPSMDDLLAAQALWDATMAHSVATYLLRRPDGLVVHIVGAFHVEEGAGLPSVLRRYRPGTEAVVVVLRPDAAWDPERHEGLGDFVILTGQP